MVRFGGEIIDLCALVHHLPIELSGSPGDDGRAQHSPVALDAQRTKIRGLRL